MIKIFTDGSATAYIKNGKKIFRGGCAYIVVNDGVIVHEFSKGSRNTTNNIMELTSILEAMKYVNKITNNTHIEIYSDSNYSIQGINTWMWKWKLNGWKKSNKKSVLNLELWKEIYHEVDTTIHDIRFKWIKAHQSGVGISDDAMFNNKVDIMAREASLV